MVGIFSNTVKPKTEKEKTITSIIERICLNEKVDIRICPTTRNVFLTLEDQHYDIVIMDRSIIITNTVFTSRDMYDERFTTYLKGIVYERATKDRMKVLDSILQREEKMLKDIEESLGLDKI